LTRSTVAAVFHGPATPIEFREIPLPRLQDQEILVEVVACTMCGSDLHSLHGRRPVPTPTILGHEILGRIAEFGPHASRLDAADRELSVGDRVTWGVVASCGDCFYCLRRLPQKCERQTKYGHEPIRPGRELTGGLAGHCVLAAGTAVFRVPDHLSDAVVCPANCATATVGAALDAAGPLVGARVLVMGCGMLGLTAAAWARSLGAETVVACDVDHARLNLTDAFGASHRASPENLAEVVRESTNGYGVDVTLELTGSPEAIEAAVPLVRIGGTVVLVGSVCPTRPVPIVPEQIVRRCLTLRGIHNYRPRDLEAALGFLGSQPSFPFDTLVSEWQPLSALEQLQKTPGSPHKPRIGLRPAQMAR
jgi:putative phosphonate catabolism associated alcohol dehydrogenase